jgi:ribose 5-phosphate isomerase B
MRHPVADAVARRLRDAGWEVLSRGGVGGDDTPWPQVAEEIGALVARGEADLGVVCCWTGTGVSIAANKVTGARAALCGDAETARGARRWNDANVLALSLRATSEAVAAEIVDAFTQTTDIDPAEADNIRAVDGIGQRHGAAVAGATAE